ncbi:MAG: TonB-dependent siderophore receptor [Polaromonas sp.]|nr:TonB-dependent siderophore receptor [Polaromonas sp.]
MASRLKLTPFALALAASASLPSIAQTAPARLEAITVIGKAAPLLDVGTAEVTGFGAPLAKSPISVTVLSADLLTASGVQTLSQAIKLDASLADSYNTTGYIESLSIRGFLLDQSGNFSRNGLATSNIAPIALESMERIEVLKGVAGLQSGVAAPGGLVNYVTKLPLKQPFTRATLGADGRGGAKLQLDVNQKLGSSGVRLNLVDESLHPQFDDANGSRQLLSLALATELDSATSVSADFSYHRKSQPSVPGLGLLDSNGDGVGDMLPGGINPRLNLNNQVWSQPFQGGSTTAEVVITHRLAADWSARLAANTQNIHINDRLAFPDGCSSAPSYVYPGLCANGDVDIYDYRSDGERRTVSSWDARLDGKFKALGLQHATRLGLNWRTASADLAPMQAYNWVGITNIYAPVALQADPTLTSLNTDSRERALAGYATLTSDLSPGVQSFVGARVTRLIRSSERSDGTRAVSFEQTVTTPWAGLAWSPGPSTTIYVSWGQGVELEAVPNRPDRFANSGQVLPALKSEQTEIGLKWQANPRLLLTAAAFSVDKPYADDVPAADPAALPTQVAGAKTARHRGIELSAAGRLDAALSLQASLMALDAKYTEAVDQPLVGQRVTNLPRLKASLFADYRLAALPGLSFNGLATFENGKKVTADGRVGLPSAWQLDAGFSYIQRVAGKETVWRFNIENLSNRSYWREAPTTYWGGVYLFPATPRTLRASVTVDF